MSEAIIETEETLVIETPERVPLAFALASIGNRFLAAAIDHFIQYLSIGIVLWIVFSASDAGGDAGVTGMLDEIRREAPKWMVAIFIFILLLLFAGYFIFFEWLWNGQTPGKRLMKLRVIREDGRPITLWEAVTRNLLRVVDAIPGLFV